jgi:hypothetical protein
MLLLRVQLLTDLSLHKLCLWHHVTFVFNRCIIHLSCPGVMIQIHYFTSSARTVSCPLLPYRIIVQHSVLFISGLTSIITTRHSNDKCKGAFIVHLHASSKDFIIVLILREQLLIDLTLHIYVYHHVTFVSSGCIIHLSCHGVMMQIHYFTSSARTVPCPLHAALRNYCLTFCSSLVLLVSTSP